MSEESEDSLRIPEGDLTHSGSRSPSPSPSPSADLDRVALEEKILMKLAEFQMYHEDWEYMIRGKSAEVLEDVLEILSTCERRILNVKYALAIELEDALIEG